MDLRYDLRLPAQTAADRLRAVIDMPSAAYQAIPGLTGGRQFVGWVREDGFEIHVRRTNYNSLAPRAHGRIEARGSGCQVTVRVEASSLTKNGLAGLIAATGIAGALVLVAAGFPLLVGVIVATALLGTSVALIRSRPGRGFPYREEERLKELLDGVFAATPLAQLSSEDTGL